MAVRIGIIGGGKFGEVHLRTFRQMAWDGILEPVALCRLNEAELQKQCAEYHLSGYTDYREMLAKETLDAVSICTPDHLHREMALAAIDRGLHVLVEKPMDTTSAGCQEIID